jgi:DNA polymerase-3 subunit delta
MTERMLHWFSETHGMRSVSLRYFNAAGDSFDSLIGEDWSVTTNLVPVVMKATLGKRDALKVYKIVDYFARNQKNYPLVMTIGTLYGYFTKLLLIHTLDDKTDKNVASVIGIHPFIAKDYIASARIYPYGKLRHIITFLREADMMSKGIGYPALSEKEILNELMYKILN